MVALSQVSRSISIHAPRGGSDFSQAFLTPSQAIFQSTLPVGGATFNENDARYILKISIHAPRGGSDMVL